MAKSAIIIVLLMFLSACAHEDARRFSGVYGGFNGGVGSDSTARP